MTDPRGVLEVYMMGGGGGGGGSDRASYCKPKKIHKPEILDPQKYLALIFPTQKQDYKCTLYCLLNINSFPPPPPPVMYTLRTPPG